MAKKFDYAAMFTLRADGRYCHTYTGEGGNRRYLYDRDPEALYGKVQALSEPKIVTLRDAAEAWHNAVWEGFSSGTRCCYSPPYKRALEWHGDRPLIDITAGDINAVMLWMKGKDYAQKTIKMQRTVYKLIFERAIIGGHTRYNPAAGLKLPAGVKRPQEREAPEDDVIQVIKDGTARYFGMFPFFLLYTGMRKSEALALTWGDIDFKAGAIHITKSLEYPANRPTAKGPKTTAGLRSVPLLAPLKEKLKRPAGALDSALVFPGPGDVLMTVSAYSRRWNRWCKEAGLVSATQEVRQNKRGKDYTVAVYKPTMSAHQLRHAYATILFEAEVDEFTAKELLGHADISTTRAVYTHLRNKQRDKGRAKLEAYFSDDVVNSVVNETRSD